MKLRQYLKLRMERFANRTAFKKSGITYADILSWEKPPTSGKKFRLCLGATREETAIAVLLCIAEGDVCVPIAEEYGVGNCDYIRNAIKSTEEDADDLAFVLFTSGTTGKPKGVMLTDENICANLDAIATYFDLSDRKNICITRPLVHSAVLVGELLYALCCGLTIDFYEEPFVPQRLLSYLAANETDVFCATPTLFTALARANGGKKFEVKTGAISGEKLTENAAREIAAAFPDTRLYHVYGLTEHSPRVSALLPDEFASRPGRVGKPLAGVETQIADGELLIKSPCVMKGYLDDAQSTQVKITDNWLHTGDCAHFDSDGYLYIDGRKDNMIIRAGLNVYPEEIEAAAKECDGVEDCVAYCEESPAGKNICLDFVGAAEPRGLRKFLLDRLNPCVVPSKITKAEKIAYTASGKKVRK